MKDQKFNIILIMQIIAFLSSFIVNCINLAVKGELILEVFLFVHLIVLATSLFALYVVVPLIIKIVFKD
jgi:hypothetical protein